MAEEIAVNRYCLVEDLDNRLCDRKALLERSS